MKSGIETTGVVSGFADLDKLTAGLQPTDLLILAARPSMGKTALGLQIVQQAAQAGVPGLVFSIEMGATQLLLRMLSSLSAIPSDAIRRGRLTQSDFDSLFVAADDLSKWPMWIDDTPAISITELRSKARRMKKRENIGLLMVDYLQLMRGPKNSQSREQEISEISRSLKALAKELKIPILALSQLNRDLEKRKSRRPMLSDLRESGAIEQDADVVMFIYREEYYLKNKEPKPGTEEHFKWQAEMEQVHGRAEIIIGKQRHGPTGTVPLHFDADITRFTNLAREDGLPERM
jgi:replicative DNA helicase